MALGKNIKGITIEFNGNTTKLERALKDVKNEAKGVDKELKDVKRLLKLDPHNTELLAQKQTLLRTKVHQTKEELAALRATQARLDDDPAVDKTSRDYMELRREIIRTEQKLRQLEKDERGLGTATAVTTEKMKRQARQGRMVTKNLGGIKNALRGMVGYAAAAFSVGAIIQFGKETLEASAAQTEAETKLETIMKQRMKSTDAQIQKIKELTAVQQKNGVIGDEVQLAGAQQLATFLKQEQSLNKLIPAMNNLAAQQKGVNATSSDMTSIANLMGKAMNGNVGALKRVGISFTDAQAEVLKYGTEEEKAAMLSQVITDNVGEMNSKLLETDAGKIQQAKNSFGDLKEEIGAKLLPVLADLAEKIGPIIDKIITFIENASNPDTEVGAVFKDFSDFVTKCRDKLILFNQSMGTTNNGLTALKVALTLLKVPIAVVTAGMMAAQGVFQLVTKGGRGVINTFITMGQGFKELAIMAKNAVMTVITLFQQLWSKIAGVVNNIISKFREIKEKITAPFTGAYEKISGIIEKIKNLFPLKLGKLFGDIKLPKITISKGKAPWGLGGKGVKPDFGLDWVNWYAKGGIFKSPTVIGVGEAGSEAVVPLDKLWSAIDQMKSGDQTFNFTINATDGQSAREIANEVKRMIIQETKRSEMAWQ